ncbi:hypothetical protein ACMWQC_00170 [Helicobacter pylori]|uniref:hypothetical protein n=1 Tax=Helicobacter pylori TaxID=210 RepID=UPI001C8246D4
MASFVACILALLYPADSKILLHDLTYLFNSYFIHKNIYNIHIQISFKDILGIMKEFNIKGINYETIASIKENTCPHREQRNAKHFTTRDGK